jgi:hypothetical protein
MIRRMRLTADSILDVDSSFGFFGEDNDKPTFVDLGGHTLELQIGAGKYFRNYNTTYINGTVDITSGGWFLTGGSYVTASNVDFKVKSALYIASPFSMRGYEANFYSTGSNSQYAQMTVAGVFKPTVAAYYGCTMLAGSTMDLTAWPKAAGWPMASAFGANGKTNLEFANSGEITVKLAGRDDLKALAKSENPHLFTWTVVDGNPVVPGATFVLDPATAAAGYRLRKDATGVLLLCEFPDFWFGTMHLDLAETNRLRQVGIVRNAVAAKSRDKPVFLTGDWNATPKSRTLDAMREFMTVLSTEKHRTFHGFKGGKIAKDYCIDYIAIDNAHAEKVAVRETHVTEEPVASDHNPVVAVVALGAAVKPVEEGAKGSKLIDTTALIQQRRLRLSRAAARILVSTRPIIGSIGVG